MCQNIQLTSESKEDKSNSRLQSKWNYSIRDKTVNVNAKQTLWLQQQQKKEKREKKGKRERNKQK